MLVMAVTNNKRFINNMNTFYIVRHGETENNRSKRLSGWVDTPLTSEGLKVIDGVIGILKPLNIDEIYSSDLGRAFITAYRIAQNLNYSKEIYAISGLREVNYGDAAHMYSAQAYSIYPELDRGTHYTPPNGESLDYMQQRVFATLNSIDKSFTDSNILLVSHSGVMAAIRAKHLGVDFGQHNISEAYPHNYVGKFTISGEEIVSWERVKKQLS